MRKLLILMSLSISTAFAASTPKLPVNLLIAPTLTQNAFAHTPANLPLNKSLLTKAAQEKFHKAFLKHYYFPWSKQATPTEFSITANGKDIKSVENFEKAAITSYELRPGYTQTYHPISKAFIKHLATNMQLKTFPNVSCQHSDMCHGIAVTNTNIRTLPTTMPSYGKITRPGQAYPFDNFQESNLWLGTPVQVVQISKDKKWFLIKGPGLVGWVQANSIAFTSKQFMQQWQQHKLLTPILRQATIDHNLQMHFPINLYLGTFLPEIKKQAYGYIAQIPLMGAKHQAITATYHISNDFVAQWPLTPTPRHFNRIINEFLGMTYGWGGMGFDTDCSGTMRRLFGAFGIWLPRNSKSQLEHAGTMLAFTKSKYSVKQRKAFLINHAKLKPYLTLIGFGGEHDAIGHVTLYLGKYSAKQTKGFILFQSVWGAHIMQGKTDVGRAILGKAVISKMGFGDNLDLLNTGYSIQSLWQEPGIYTTNIG